MTSLQERERHTPESPWSRMDRLFDEWMRTMPVRRLFGIDVPGNEIIRVDEYRDKDTQVIRAELPGIDPEKDVEITVADGMLRISAERRDDSTTDSNGYTRHELHYGSFTRTLPLAEGATPDDIEAAYRDGVLEIRVPVAPPKTPAEPRKVAVSHG